MPEKLIRRLFAECAQQVYDDWHQDEDGCHDELGGGGICDLIADEVCLALGEAGFECWTHRQEDPNHTWVLVELPTGIFHVDIPFHIYEEYQGPYCFHKIPNVRLRASDVLIWQATPEEAAASLEEWEESEHCA